MSPLFPHPSRLSSNEKLIVVMVYSCVSALLAGALAFIVLTSSVEVSTATATMFGVAVAFGELIVLLLALLLVAVWDRP